MDCISPGSPVHGILQARILEWVVNSSSRWSSPPKDRTHVSCVSCSVSRFFITEPPGKPNLYLWDDSILLFILLLAMRASSNLTEHPFGFCYIGQPLLCGGAQTTQRQHRGFRVCPHPIPTISLLAVPCHARSAAANNMLSHKLILKWLMSIPLSSGKAEEWGTWGREKNINGATSFPWRKTPQDLGTPCISAPPTASVSLCREIFLNNGTFSCFNQMQFRKQFLWFSKSIKTGICSALTLKRGSTEHKHWKLLVGKDNIKIPQPGPVVWEILLSSIMPATIRGAWDICCFLFTY